MPGTLAIGLKFDDFEGSSRLKRGITTAVFQADGTVSVAKLVLMMRRIWRPNSAKTSFRILIGMSPFIDESLLGSENRARLSSLSVIGVSLIDPALTLGNRVGSLFRFELSNFAITSSRVSFPTFVKYSFSSSGVKFSGVFPGPCLGAIICFIS